MEKLLIDGKFKEDFLIWINKIKLNYNFSFERFEFTYNYYQKIDCIMKFLHNIDYSKSYGPNEHGIYSFDTIQKLIDEYNEEIKN